MANPTDTAIEQEARKVLSYGLSHLIMLIACALLLVGSVYLYDSRRADQADARAALAEAKAKFTQDQNTTVQAQTQEQIAALAEQNKVLQSQVGALASSIEARDAQLAQRQAQITTLPPSDLAQEWGAAAQEPAPGLDSQGHFLATLPLAQKSLAAFEAEKALAVDKQDLTQELQGQHAIADNNAAALGKEQAAHLSDQNACTASKAALQAEVKKAKTDARRSKLRWAAGGFISGVLAMLAHFI
jgi:hypothetical protein